MSKLLFDWFFFLKKRLDNLMQSNLDQYPTPFTKPPLLFESIQNFAKMYTQSEALLKEQLDSF